MLVLFGDELHFLYFFSSFAWIHDGIVRCSKFWPKRCQTLLSFFFFFCG